MLHDVISFTLLAFSAIFFVVDPFAVVPVFVSMTEGDDEAKRARMALKACLLCAGILTFFALGGGIVFKLLGITLAAFKIAGGVVLILTALDMLRSQTVTTRTSPGEIAEAAGKPGHRDRAIGDASVGRPGLDRRGDGFMRASRRAGGSSCQLW